MKNPGISVRYGGKERLQGKKKKCPKEKSPCTSSRGDRQGMRKLKNLKERPKGAEMKEKAGKRRGKNLSHN